jgi:hypothetical protein
MPPPPLSQVIIFGAGGGGVTESGYRRVGQRKAPQLCVFLQTTCLLLASPPPSSHFCTFRVTTFSRSAVNARTQQTVLWNRRGYYKLSEVGGRSANKLRKSQVRKFVDLDIS